MGKIPEDIKQLDEKIAALRQRETGHQQEKKETGFGKASRIGFRIGVELLSAIIVGAAIGYLFDGILGTRPWGMTAFLFFGFAAGVLNVYRLAQQEDKYK